MITTQRASLAATNDGGKYGYRGSKVAVNMFVRTLAADLRPAGVIVLGVDPGWVRTDIGRTGGTNYCTRSRGRDRVIRAFDACPPFRLCLRRIWSPVEMVTTATIAPRNASARS